MIEDPGVMRVALRDTLVDLGLLRFDDLGDLRVYSYTDRCVFKRAWNDLTLNSRGIIFNRATGECVAQPFPKFFMVGETPDLDESVLPWDRVERITEKLDGFLGILYRPPGGGFAVATRGSFHTEAAVWATESVQGHGLAGLPDAVTLCFELVHPMTRVVVDYHGRQDLVLLAAFNRHTGLECPWSQVQTWAESFGFPLPREYPLDVEALCRTLATADGTEFEGFVVSFAGKPGDGGPFRAKLKTADYLARFRALSASRHGSACFS